MKNTISLLGCPCHPVNDVSELTDYIKEAVFAKKGGYTVAINAEKIMLYQKLLSIKTIIEGAFLKSPDGFGAVLAANLLYRISIAKINLPKLILDISNAEGCKVFLLGATEEANAMAYENIGVNYPNINLCGRHNGYYSNLALIKQCLIESCPDIVLIGMGSPKQEIISVELISDFPHTIFVGCGGAIDLFSGKTKRAPKFMIDHGLEWLYRLIKEPRRFKRYLLLPMFLLKLIYATVRTRINITLLMLI